jgi:hypothetical protein
VGPRAGRKVFTLQGLPAGEYEPCSAVAGRAAGFSLHAGVAVRADERGKLERLCRYISRPAVSEARLSLTAGGLVRYQLKTPYSDGTTHVLFEPLDFIARLAALVPKPRVNLTRLPRTVRTPQRPPGAGDEVRAGPRRKAPPRTASRPSAGPRRPGRNA